MITDEIQTWPLCALCADGTRIPPYFVAHTVTKLVAGTGFGIQSLWACHWHTDEAIEAYRKRLREANGVAVLQGVMVWEQPEGAL